MDKMTEPWVNPYLELEINKTKIKTMRQLASSILLSALDDADVEFLTDDFHEYKEWRINRTKKINSDLEYKRDFEDKQNYKECLFELCGMRVTTDNIPSDVLRTRILFEKNQITDLCKITNLRSETLTFIARTHGWTIGINASIFDL
jgi:hypothetical protein